MLDSEGGLQRQFISMVAALLATAIALQFNFQPRADVVLKRL